MKKKLLVSFTIFLFLSASQLLRVNHSTLDETIWIQSGISFTKNIINGHPEKTNISTRPGVTVEILTGSTTILERSIFHDKNLFRLTLTERDLLINRVVFGLIISILTSLLFFPLTKLMELKNSSLTCLLIGLNPLILSGSSAWTDIFLGIFLFYALILYTIYEKEEFRKKFLISTGVAFGLALASKTFGFILIPCIFISSIVIKFDKTNFKKSFISSLLVLLIGLIVFFVIYPYLWTNPLGIIQRYPELSSDLNSSLNTGSFGTTSFLLYPFLLIINDLFLTSLAFLVSLPIIGRSLSKPLPITVNFFGIFFLVNLLALIVVSQAKYHIGNPGQTIADYRYLIPAVFALVGFLVVGSTFVSKNINFFNKKTVITLTFPYILLGYYIFSFFTG